MADSELCAFCSHLVVRLLEEPGQYCLDDRRSRLEFEKATKATDCSFCREFYKTAVSLRDKIEDNTRLALWTRLEGIGGFPIPNPVILYMDRWVDNDRGFEELASFKMLYSKSKVSLGGNLVSISKHTLANEVEKLQHQDPPGWKKGIMDIGRRFDSVVHWLNDCADNTDGTHDACLGTRMPARPGRLLDISRLESSGCVRLVSIEAPPAPCPEYTTLSHCWGSPTGPQPKNTTMANKAEHERAIPFKVLPRTFQDAIRITRRIGKSYIWIDSLAIVQDDKDDWRREAAKMASVYANSFLTIAATSADNCKGGCDLKSWHLDIGEGVTDSRSAQASLCSARLCGLCYPSSCHSGIRPDLDYRYRVQLKRMTKEEIYAPLHKRGWVMQERFLSRRMLHMAHHHMLWQCQAVSGSEDVLALKRFEEDNKWVRNLSLMGSKAPDRWWTLVKDYSKSEFTYPTDRIPALRGIIDYQSTQLQDIPLLGLWRKAIAHDLSWSIANNQSIALKPNVPTWSWLSSASEVEGPEKLEEVLFRLHVGFWTIDWTEEIYVSELKQFPPQYSSSVQTCVSESEQWPLRCSLFVASRIIERVIELDLNSEVDPPFSHRAIEEHLQHMFNQVTLTWNESVTNAWRDNRSAYTRVRWSGPIEHPTPHQITITCLLLYADTGRIKARGDNIRFLILKRVAHDVRIYTRMGLGSVYSGDSVSGSLDPPADPQFPTPLIDWVLKTWKGSILELR